jgi:hypothetical protein
MSKSDREKLVCYIEASQIALADLFVLEDSLRINLDNVVPTPPLITSAITSLRALLVAQCEQYRLEISSSDSVPVDIS